MKKLCVISDVIGKHDVIHNSDNSFVCREVNKFVSAIKKAQSATTERLINVAYQNVVDNYNTSAMSKQYRLIYEEKLKR